MKTYGCPNTKPNRNQNTKDRSEKKNRLGKDFFYILIELFNITKVFLFKTYHCSHTPFKIVKFQIQMNFRCFFLFSCYLKNILFLKTNILLFNLRLFFHLISGLLWSIQTIIQNNHQMAHTTNDLLTSGFLKNRTAFSYISFQYDTLSYICLF